MNFDSSSDVKTLEKFRLLSRKHRLPEWPTPCARAARPVQSGLREITFSNFTSPTLEIRTAQTRRVFSHNLIFFLSLRFEPTAGANGRNRFRVVTRPKTSITDDNGRDVGSSPSLAVTKHDTINARAT